MSLLLFCALSLFANTMAERFWLLRAGGPDARLDRKRDRFRTLIRVGFFQERLLYERGAGWMHALIFAGFMVVSIRTVTLVGVGFTPDFHLPFLDGPLGLLYAFLKDTFEVVVIAALLFALYRRLVVRPKRLHLSLEANLILLWIGALMVTDLLVDGALIAQHPAAREKGWAWASTLVASLLSGSEAEALQRHLGRAGFRTRRIAEFGLEYLRLSTHLYVLPRDLERAVALVADAPR